MPSLYEEGYGRVILEALSCGVPVIASNRGGMKEILNDSIGVLVEPTEEEIIKALRETDFEKLAKNCRPYAEKMFSSNNAKVIEEAYEN